MAFGTPVLNSAHGNVIATPFVYSPSVAAVTAGRIIVVMAYATQATSLTPPDLTITDTSAAPLTWTPVFSPQPVSDNAAVRSKVQWWWAVSDGASKTLSISATTAVTACGATIFDFSIGAGKIPDFTNKASAEATTGTSTTTDPVCTLPTVPGATDLGLFHKIGQGGGALTAATGWTSLSRTAVNSRTTDCAYDTSSPAQSVTWTNTGNPAALITMAALVEGTVGGTTAIPPGLLRARPTLPLTRW